MAAISIENINKAFGGTPVLRDICLSIAPGEFLSLVGPSGCGKSTLLRIIAGLEKHDSGSLTIDSQIVDDVRPSERNLAMVFQSYALYPHLSVAENIAVPLRLRQQNQLQRLPLIGRLAPGSKRARQSIRTQIEAVAETLNLTHLLDRKPAQLSGGQRQRVAVGRALVRQPTAFLLDEPLSNLDAQLRVQLRTEIVQLHKKLREQARTTFVYVTHDQAEAMTMSDRIAVMDQGRILQVASPERIYARPANTTVATFIGSPGINLLEVTTDSFGEISRLGTTLGLRTDMTNSGLTLGVRPECIQAICPKSNTALNGTVVARENLGAESMIHVEIAPDRQPMIVRVSADQAAIGAASAQIGARIGLQLNAASTHLFDQDGVRLDQKVTTTTQCSQEFAA